MVTELYDGRFIDIYAWGAPDGTMIDETTSGRVITGILKLAQRFLITLLNEPNSIKYDYELTNIQRGTTFMQALRLGGVHNEAQLRSTFALAELQARSQLQAEEDNDMPDDERYAKSEIVRAELEPGIIRLTITLESRAESVQLIVPIPIVPTATSET
jgi:hypothetical protein